jgi:hypothetical protein
LDFAKGKEGENLMMHKGEGLSSMDDRNMVGIASPPMANGKISSSFRSIPNDMNFYFFGCV